MTDLLITEEDVLSSEPMEDLCHIVDIEKPRPWVTLCGLPVPDEAQPHDDGCVCDKPPCVVCYSLAGERPL